MSEPTFPVAEMFYSIQGEATRTGTPMFFVRLAGCNVGRYIPTFHVEPEDPHATPFQLLHPEYATCTSFSGEEFICDTDYRVKERLTASQILLAAQASGTKWVSLTGGEPAIHKGLPALILLLHRAGLRVNLETSGTILLEGLIPTNFTNYNEDLMWVVSSPKEGFLRPNVEFIDEYKFLMRGGRDEMELLHFLEENEIFDEQVWLQPVDEMEPGAAATPAQVSFAVECVKRHSKWRLSCQTHKWLGVR